LRDRLEALQREVRALEHERTLPETPAFARERAALVSTVTQLERRVESLQGHLDESRATLHEARTSLARVELALRAGEQRTLSSALLLGALLVVAVVGVTLTPVPAEAWCAVSAAVLGWTLGARRAQLRFQVFEGDGLVWSWSGGLVCIALSAFCVLRCFTHPGPAEPWSLAALPALLLACAAVTLSLGARHRIGLIMTACATLFVAFCAVPEAQPLVRRLLDFAQLDAQAVARVANRLLSPLLIAAFVWAHDQPPTERARPALLASLLGLAAWCCVGGAFFGLAAQLTVAALCLALCVRGRARWALVALAVMPALRAVASLSWVS
jgi:hypothetical protein